MGFVGTARRLLLGLSVLGFGAGCVQSSDPAIACEAMDLGEDEGGTFATQRNAPVLMLVPGSARDSSRDRAFLVFESCENSANCELTQWTLQQLAPRSPVLLTSDGKYALGINRDNNVLFTWDIAQLRQSVIAQDPQVKPPLPTPSLTDGGPVELVAGLRNSSWVIARNDRGELLRLQAGTSYVDSSFAAAPENLRVTAQGIGEHHIIARLTLSDTREQLYLLPVDNELPYADGGPIGLISGPTFSYIELSPRDEFVIATSGTGEAAETFVFRVPDGKLVQRFDGQVVAARDGGTRIPGLRASSPDGSHFAYRTETGAMAMRAIDSGNACLLRSPNAGDHRVAGFSSDGIIYFESHADRYTSQVLSFDLRTRTLSPLSPQSDDFVLTAVPGQLDVEVGPWAIGSRWGAPHGLVARSQPQSLDFEEAVFVPRDEYGFWTVESRESTAEQTISIHKLAPGPGAGERNYEFLSGDRTIPTIRNPQTNTTRQAKFSANEQLCMSTGSPSSWGYWCGQTKDLSSFIRDAGPSSEQEHPSQAEDPEPTVNDTNHCSARGVPRRDTEDCIYLTEQQCCYDTLEEACESLSCAPKCVNDYLGPTPLVSCG